VPILRHPRGMTVTVTVRYFAGAQAAAGVPEEDVVLPVPATLAALTESVLARHGEPLARVFAAASYIVDEVATRDGDVPLADGSRVDVLPPFAGG
jgi:sulfur-carrier protein